MLERYGHGGDLLSASEAFGLPPESYVDFSSNMNPLGPPQGVRDVLARYAAHIHAYPDPAVRELRLRLAERHGVDEACILVGNGAAELIDLAVRWRRPAAVGLAVPCFAEYEEAARKCGADLVRVTLNEAADFTAERAVLEAQRPGLWLLGSPNNPTGRLLPRDIPLALAASGATVVVDEAFIDFVPEESRISLAREAAGDPSLLVLRSMTKYYAIPGIRLGYAIGHPETIAALRELQVPWSVNSLAQQIGCAVLEDDEYAHRTRRWLAEERLRLEAGLNGLGLRVVPSAANYVLAELPGALGLTAAALQRQLGPRGLLIRDGGRFDGLGPRWLRVAVRLRTDNERLLDALAAALAPLGATGAASAPGGTPVGAPANGSARRWCAAPSGPGRAADCVSTAPSGPGSTGDLVSTAQPAQGRAADPVSAAQPGPAPAANRASGAEGSASEAKPKQPARTLMIQGTASDAGKSLLVTALCRSFARRGRRTAPFKAQNMSNNSYVTWDGKEIGRAQGMQAEACGILADTDMNPILLKPTREMSAQVVVHGVALRDYEARAYREQFLAEAGTIVTGALRRLRMRCDVVVLEGAGSPAEINLKDRDIVNMQAAAWADAPVLLVADIDRGGALAALVGTLELLEPHERDRVAGLIINKFRGDVSLLRPGLDWLERRTGKPVLGVVPYLPGLALESEDTLSLEAAQREAERAGSRGAVPAAEASTQQAGEEARSGQQEHSEHALLDIAVLRLPHLSNFTDFDPLRFEPDVRLRYVEDARRLGEPDALVLPGSKNVMDDLLHLRASGLAEAVLHYAARGGHIVGICGGYEMLGRRLCDPDHAESVHDELDGLGLLPLEVRFAHPKRTVRMFGTARLPGWTAPEEVEGYEIHTGQMRVEPGAGRPLRVRPADVGHAPLGVAQPDTAAAAGSAARPPADERTASVAARDSVEADEGACTPDGRIWGTFLHGVLHGDAFRRRWLNGLRAAKGYAPLPVQLHFRRLREAEFDRLADHIEAHCDMARIEALLQGEAIITNNAVRKGEGR
ncbi:cobyric acid synthase [Paenibacillus sp. IB182496]|uniref:Cobyric acid synthase n=1 Tax=Paenibacillus sabuli TaxID=2772509 RepID=A0A927BWH6_9BACL|nr:cobyric acid synthase [Paenibacillus sabuli]MBD2846784.1 cobyric acid synthase [Paenibacillus sabuli]